MGSMLVSIVKYRLNMFENYEDMKASMIRVIGSLY